MTPRRVRNSAQASQGVGGIPPSYEPVTNVTFPMRQVSARIEAALDPDWYSKQRVNTQPRAAAELVFTRGFLEMARVVQ